MGDLVVPLDDSEGILRRLSWRGAHTRYECIAPPHSGTFEWIFEQPDFTEFLENGSGCYCIHGKPASGMSTLMKFIFDDSRTKQMLESGAGTGRLVLASHFFWKIGDDLQRSAMGLLRKLLLDILQENQDLIPTAFGGHGREIDLASLDTLSSAMEVLLNRTEQSHKYCIFIDGLHEFDQKPSFELVVHILHRLAMGHVKIVVSCRRNAFFLAYLSEYPGIRLDQHTHQDIHQYVTETIGRIRLSRWRSIDDDDMLADVLRSIVRRANGVFFWVVLATRSIAEGIYSYDTAKDLQIRLEEIPGDMEHFYIDLMRGKGPLEAKTSSRMIRIMLRGEQLLRYGGLSPYQLRFTDRDEALDFAVQLRRKPLSTENLLVELRSIERDVMFSEPEGAIQIELKRVDEPSTAIVGFVHDSLGRFLAGPRLRDNLIIDRDGDIDTLLLASCVWESKVLPQKTDIILYGDRVLDNAMNSLFIVQQLEARRARPYTALMDQLDIAVSAYWNRAQRCKGYPDAASWESTLSTTWPMFVIRNRHPSAPHFTTAESTLHPFLVMAVLSGCLLYATDKAMAGESCPMSSSDKAILLAHAASQAFGQPDDNTRHHESYRRHRPHDATDEKALAGLGFNIVTAVGQLLEHGANPNARISLIGTYAEPSQPFPPPSTTGAGTVPPKTSAWSYFLDRIASISGDTDQQQDQDNWYRKPERAMQLLQIFQKFLLGGAELATQPGLGQLNADVVLHQFEAKLYKSNVDSEQRKLLEIEFENTKKILLRMTREHCVEGAAWATLHSIKSFCASYLGLVILGWSLGCFVVLLQFLAIGF